MWFTSQDTRGSIAYLHRHIHLVPISFFFFLYCFNLAQPYILSWNTQISVPNCALAVNMTQLKLLRYMYLGCLWAGLSLGLQRNRYYAPCMQTSNTLVTKPPRPLGKLKTEWQTIWHKDSLNTIDRREGSEAYLATKTVCEIVFAKVIDHRSRVKMIHHRPTVYTSGPVNTWNHHRPSGHQVEELA